MEFQKYTLLLYLTDVEEGGETYFPWEKENRLRRPGFQYSNCQWGIKVHPQKGDAVFFESLQPNNSLDERSLHGGCSVVSGTKYVATKWMHVG